MILNVQFFTLEEKYRFSITETLLKIYGNLEYSFSNVETIVQSQMDSVMSPVSGNPMCIQQCGDIMKSFRKETWCKILNSFSNAYLLDILKKQRSFEFIGIQTIEIQISIDRYVEEINQNNSESILYTLVLNSNSKAMLGSGTGVSLLLLVYHMIHTCQFNF